MTTFSDALKNAGIIPAEPVRYNKETAGSLTLEMKLYEMKSHISAMARIYQKYLSADGDDKFDFVDSLANRYGYMVISFQDIMTTIGKLNGSLNKTGNITMRRAISEFQSLFEQECKAQRLDDAVSSFADRNEIVHLYENYKGNMEKVLENVQNYCAEYEKIRIILWQYSEHKGILNSN